MKFCSKCGGQCVDEAVICVSCGAPIAPTAPVAPNIAPVDPNTAPVAPSAAPLKSGGDSKLAIFDFLSNSSFLLYIASFVLSLVYAYVYTRSSSSWYSSYTYTYFYLSEEFVVVSAVLAVLVFVFAIVRLVVGLSQKDNLEVKLSGVLRLIAAVVVAVVTVFAMVEHL